MGQVGIGRSWNVGSLWFLVHPLLYFAAGGFCGFTWTFVFGLLCSPDEFGDACLCAKDCYELMM